MKVGHGVAPLPVRDGEPMGGYADRTDGIDGALDPLEAHALTFIADGVRFALIVLDLVCVNSDVVASVRHVVTTELDVDHCWVSATHTHASPEAGCVPGGSFTEASLADRIVAASARAVAGAIEAEVDLAIRPARVSVNGLACTRSDRGADAALPVDAVIFATDERVHGVLVIVPAHPTVLGADNRAVSADLTGGIRRALTENGDTWAVVATGAAGDISTRHTRRSRDIDEVDRLGSLVAESLSTSLTPVADGATVGAGRPKSVTVMLDPKSQHDLESVETEPLAPEGGSTRTIRVHRQGVAIARSIRARNRTEPYAVEIGAIRLGPITLVAIPGELFLSLGERIRDQLAATTTACVLGYANGYLGYLPPRAASTSYEVLASPVARGGGELVVDAAVQVARDVAGPR